MQPQKPTLTLNCDLGEGLDDIDQQVMPYLNCANIACGGHAGDHASMLRTVKLAKRHGVAIGAHPSYPDREGFGRTSMTLSNERLTASIREQVAALADIAATQNCKLSYIKPHGALYNDCVHTQKNALLCLIQVALELKLPLMLLAGNDAIQTACKQKNIKLIREAFADRGYLNNGHLVPRTQEGALLSCDNAATQVKHLNDRQGLYDVNGEWLDLLCDSICVHSDTPGALKTLQTITNQLIR